MSLDKELAKDLKKKFGKLADNLYDEHTTNSTYQQYTDKFNGLEPIQSNPDSLLSTDTPWQNDEYEYQQQRYDNLRDIIHNTIKLSDKDRQILKLYLDGLTQETIGLMMGVNQSYISNRIKSIAKKIKIVW